MPDLFKILARNLVLGVAAGWVTLGLLLATDTGGLATTIFASANPFLPIAILAFGFTITFGSLAMGAAIMMLPYEGDEGKSSGLKVFTLLGSLKGFFARMNSWNVLVPIPVKDRVRRLK